MSTISKKKLNKLLSLSNDPKIELLEENKKSYKIEINGDKDKVKKSNFEQSMLESAKEQKVFNDSVIDFIKEQREFNKKIESRLDVLEKDVKEIKSLPTIQQGLKTKNNYSVSNYWE